MNLTSGIISGGFQVPIPGVKEAFTGQFITVDPSVAEPETVKGYSDLVAGLQDAKVVTKAQSSVNEVAMSHMTPEQIFELIKEHPEVLHRQ